MKKSLAILLSLLLVMGILAGCGGGDNPSAQGNPDEKVLRFGCQMYSDGIVNPAAQTNGAWNSSRYGITECLYRFGDNVETIPVLAESVEVSDDHKTWVFHLREGVKFSNGTDMTATKVKESLDWVRAEGPKGSSNPDKFLENEAVITADDAANTITIQTVTAYSDLAANLADPTMSIINVAETTDFENGIIATGPYMIDKFTDQVGYDLVRNPYYWQKEVPYDQVKIMFMGDASAKANALRAGQIDLAENIMNAADLTTLQESPDFTVEIAAGVRCGFSWINHNGVLSNKTLRQAIMMAIDDDAICKSNTIGGLYTPGCSVLPSSMSYGYEKLTDPYAFDMEGAKKLLDDAGIVDSNGNGIRELDGQDIVLTYVSYENRLLNDFSDAHSLYLEELGIGVNKKYGSSDDEWQSLVAGQYDFNNNNWNTLIAGSPVSFLRNWYSKAGDNYCGFANAEYDALFEKLQNTMDNDERVEIITQLQQILIDEAAVLIDGYYNSCMIWSKNVADAHIYPVDYYWITADITPAA